MEANATGTVGPNLDEALKGKDAAFIHTSIVDPNAVIAPGSRRTSCPANFGTQPRRSRSTTSSRFVYQSTHG